MLVWYGGQVIYHRKRTAFHPIINRTDARQEIEIGFFMIAEKHADGCKSIAMHQEGRLHANLCHFNHGSFTEFVNQQSLITRCDFHSVISLIREPSALLSNLLVLS